MKIKLLLGIIVVVVIFWGYYFYDQQKRQALAPGIEHLSGKSYIESQVDSIDDKDLNAHAETSIDKNETLSQGRFSDESDIDGVDVQAQEIIYDGTAFSSKNITIKIGDTVIFRNNSQTDFWPASGSHPTHTAYPEFDSKAAIAPGKSFDFKFTRLGVWDFHDHLNPQASGTVTVTE